jgi:hypothetical protein
MSTRQLVTTQEGVLCARVSFLKIRVHSTTGFSLSRAESPFTAMSTDALQVVIVITLLLACCKKKKLCSHSNGVSFRYDVYFFKNKYLKPTDHWCSACIFSDRLLKK